MTGLVRRAVNIAVSYRCWNWGGTDNVLVGLCEYGNEHDS
jgi:hypothetical protein